MDDNLYKKLYNKAYKEHTKILHICREAIKEKLGVKKNGNAMERKVEKKSMLLL